MCSVQQITGSICNLNPLESQKWPLSRCIFLVAWPFCLLITFQAERSETLRKAQNDDPLKARPAEGQLWPSDHNGKGSFQKRFSGFCQLRGYPPPLTPLTENQCEKKKVFFLSGKGGYPPPLTESPLSFSGKFFPKRAKNDVFFIK